MANGKIIFEKTNHRLPDEGYLRLWQIIGGKGFPALYPISKSSWWNGVRSGRYPQPVKLGERTTAWRVSDIRNLLEGDTPGDHHED